MNLFHIFNLPTFGLCTRLAQGHWRWDLAITAVLWLWGCPAGSTPSGGGVREVTADKSWQCLWARHFWDDRLAYHLMGRTACTRL